VREGGQFILYWMTIFRRVRSNFALQRALEWGEKLKKPVVVLETLKVDYPYASERIHAFMLQGTAENRRRMKGTAVLHHPWVGERPGADEGLVADFAARACVVVADDWPAFFLPKYMADTAAPLGVRFEVVDSNGLLPLAATERVFTTAFSFRAFLQKELPKHLGEASFPAEDPVAAASVPRATPALLKGLVDRWPAASDALLEARPEALAALPLDHRVKPVGIRGGSHEAEALLAQFLSRKLARYPEDRDEPELDGTTGLSPYLHFGHLCTHQVFRALARHERWTPEKLGKSNGGKREGYWKMSPAAEAFVDQFVTWRELGFNGTKRADFFTPDGLPAFARATLEKHRPDTRKYRYSYEQFESGRTHDPLWNAAQLQMVRTGWMHNYLRMLWGKKILEWSSDHREAYATMERLMNTWALDGRDPNSYSGYGWVCGLYDRAWGPERPIFGTVRYMSSDNTARKLRVKDYIRRYAP
jgi:deoxyribodipyrimidine photo-lyase